MSARSRLALAALFVGLVAVLATAQTLDKVWRVGYLSVRRRPEPLTPQLKALIQRLHELGYTEGKNLSIEWCYAGGDYDRLNTLAAGLVDRHADVILTHGSEGILAAQRASRSVPIVFFGGADVVASGFVKSLAHPGGNTTGFTTQYDDTFGKEIDLLKSTLPRLSRLAVLLNPANPAQAQMHTGFEAAAARSGIELLFVDGGPAQQTADGISRAASGRAQALVCTFDSLFIDQDRSIAEAATRNGLPSIGAYPLYADAGGLMSYGPDIPAIYERIAGYVDSIFKGANPGDLPVQQPTKFEFVINRKTAAALGLKIPPELLVQADRVIE